MSVAEIPVNRIPRDHVIAEAETPYERANEGISQWSCAPAEREFREFSDLFLCADGNEEADGSASRLKRLSVKSSSWNWRLRIC
ncbi:hypothetical protein G7039_29225 (plasmid) [Rhizobium leguminosarum]|nr:hypothetical protein G7039_29225 [Rhizobium leguminosarum]